MGFLECFGRQGVRGQHSHLEVPVHRQLEEVEATNTHDIQHNSPVLFRLQQLRRLFVSRCPIDGAIRAGLTNLVLKHLEHVRFIIDDQNTLAFQNRITHRSSLCPTRET